MFISPPSLAACYFFFPKNKFIIYTPGDKKMIGTHYTTHNFAAAAAASLQLLYDFQPVQHF